MKCGEEKISTKTIFLAWILYMGNLYRFLNNDLNNFPFMKSSFIVFDPTDEKMEEW